MSGSSRVAQSVARWNRGIVSWSGTQRKGLRSSVSATAEASRTDQYTLSIRPYRASNWRDLSRNSCSLSSHDSSFRRSTLSSSSSQTRCERTRSENVTGPEPDLDSGSGSGWTDSSVLESRLTRPNTGHRLRPPFRSDRATFSTLAASSAACRALFSASFAAWRAALSASAAERAASRAVTNSTAASPCSIGRSRSGTCPVVMTTSHMARAARRAMRLPG